MQYLDFFFHSMLKKKEEEFHKWFPNVASLIWNCEETEWSLTAVIVNVRMNVFDMGHFGSNLDL